MVDSSDTFTIDKETLSVFDTIQLFTYSISIFAGGVFGDIFDIRKFLTLCLTGLGFSYFLLAMGGRTQIESYSYYYFVFFLIGLCGASIWPMLIHMMGNWFSKKHRGLIIGAWATCANIGNIIGIQLAAILIKVFKQKWSHLIFINAIISILSALLTLWFLVPHPKRIGITINENEHPINNSMNVEQRPLGSQNNHNSEG